MTESKASEATAQKDGDKNPAAKTAAAKPSAKSVAESAKLPSASAPAVATEAFADHSDTTLAAGEAADLRDKKGGYGPFTDTAPPVGAALDVLTDNGDAAAVFDFDVADVPFTVVEGDVQVSVRENHGRAIVEVSPAGWVGPGQVFGANQVPALYKALGQVKGKLKKR